VQKAPTGAAIAQDIKAALTESRWVGLSVAAIVPLSFLFGNIFLDQMGGKLLKDAVESSFVGWQSSESFSFNENGLSKGPADARMTIVEFADYLCPHCKFAVPALKVFAESHPDVRVIFKAYPLDGHCNAYPEFPKGDGIRCLISKTVYCAEKLAQKGWVFYEEVFGRQEQFMAGPSKAGEILAEMATRHGLQPSELESCRNTEEAHQSIVGQSQEGVTSKIEGTPSIFVNGRFLSRGQMLPVLQRVYNSL
jgi:protein-disulfide isomerase